jgi:hypothetical protein
MRLVRVVSSGIGVGEQLCWISPASCGELDGVVEHRVHFSANHLESGLPSPLRAAAAAA